MVIVDVCMRQSMHGFVLCPVSNIKYGECIYLADYFIKNMKKCQKDSEANFNF